MKSYKYKYLTYKHKQIKFMSTDKGNLFSVKNLINIVYNDSYTQYNKVSLHNSLFLIVGNNTFRCTGLMGFREIVADRYDDFKDLEELLILNNIIQGDLPAADTLKLLNEYEYIHQKGIKAGSKMFKTENCFVSISKFVKYSFFISNCSYSGGGNRKKIDFITEDKEFTTMDHIFFHVNDMLYMLGQNHFVDQYDAVYKHKDLIGTYKLLRDGPYRGEYCRKVMFCNLNFFKQVIKDSFAIKILQEIEADTDLFSVKQNIIKALQEQQKSTVKHNKCVKHDTSYNDQNSVSYNDVVKICYDIITPVIEENRKLMTALEQIRAATYSSIMDLLKDKQLQKR